MNLSCKGYCVTISNDDVLSEKYFFGMEPTSVEVSYCIEYFKKEYIDFINGVIKYSVDKLWCGNDVWEALHN